MNRIRQIFQMKGSLIAISILAAIALWLYVVYITDSDITVNLNNVTVNYEGTEVLSENNYVVTNADVKTISISITGKRTAISRLSSDNISVIVDMEQILKTGVPATGINQLGIQIVYPDFIEDADISNVAKSVDYAAVTVEKMISKEVPVNAIFNGSVADGYQTLTMSYSPSTITISGTEADLSSVSYCLVTLEQENVSETGTYNLPVSLMSYSSETIDMEKITFSQDYISVTLPVVMVKEVPLYVNMIYGASATENNVSVSIEPSSLTLSGDASILNDYNKLVVGTIDLTEFVATDTEDFIIVIPNGLTNVTGANVATVRVEVKGQASKRLSCSNLMVKNVTEGYSATIVTQSLDVILRGPEASLNEITAENIRIVADLVELGNTEGTIGVNAKIYIDGFTDVDPIGTYTMSVSISKTEATDLP